MESGTGTLEQRGWGSTLCVKCDTNRSTTVWFKKETVVYYGTAQHGESTQGFICCTVLYLFFSNNKMNRVRKESAQPYCMRVPIIGLAVAEGEF